jgi:ADP-heptose:LPS heptosyltransferase
MFNKQWYRDRFEDVVRKIHKFGIGGPDLQVIQVGDASDPMIAGCVDLRGKTSLRETAAILKNSLALIGTSGLLSHMARAVDCRSVIIYGGREHSYQSGYICNENLDSKVECSPCWLWNNCDHDKKCMKMISVENVISALTRVIDRQKEFLEVEKQSI